MVASDRISAYDFLLTPGIPDKGEILTRMSLWWFDQLADIVPNHVVSTAVPERVRGRALIVEKLEMFPVECVARGYLTGSGLSDYNATGEVCGVPLPAGLVDASGCPSRSSPRRPRPIWASTTRTCRSSRSPRPVGAEGAEELRDLTLEVYARGRGDRPRARHHPGRHQARVRRPRRRHDRARRRGAHPRLLALLARGRVQPGPARSRHTTSSSSATG